jgi:hypothetical protein
MSEHETPNKMHGIFRGSFADTAARTAYVVTATDVSQGRCWRQIDTNRTYQAIATGAGAGSWRLIGSGDGAGGGSDPFGTVAVGSSPFNVTVADHKGKVLTCAVARTLNLPAPAADFYFYVKKTAAGAYAVTLDPAGAQTIEGGSAGANVDLTGERHLWRVFTDGTNWFLDFPPTGVVAI